MQWKRIDPETLSTFPYQVFRNCCSQFMALRKKIIKLNESKTTDINMWLKQAFLGLTLVLVLVTEYNGNCTVNFPCNIEKIILTVCLMVFYTAISRERLLWGRVFPFKCNISEWNKTLFTSLVLKWLLLKRDFGQPWLPPATKGERMKFPFSTTAKSLSLCRLEDLWCSATWIESYGFQKFCISNLRGAAPVVTFMRKNLL